MLDYLYSLKSVLPLTTMEVTFPEKAASPIAIETV
jgi:hypothetical protein